MRKEIKKSIWALALSSGLSISANVALGTVSGLAAYKITGDKGLSTIPFVLQYLASMSLTTPAAFLMKEIGRKKGFLIGALWGVTGGLLAAAGLLKGSFVMFCAGGLFIGGANAFSFYYRFAVAELVDVDYKARAIGYVMAGGVMGAIVGPNVSTLTSGLFKDALYAGCFFGVAFLFVIAFFLLLVSHLPRIDYALLHEPGRKLVEILRQPICISAIAIAVVGYGIMTFIMVATPLSMDAHTHELKDIAFVIQWHVLGMFAPSFFTGHLIRRFGIFNIMLVGGALNLACIMINLSGMTVPHFWLAMLFLGVGWNFLFIGGTTLLTYSYNENERAKTESFNDFLIFATVAITSYFSGLTLKFITWQQINLIALFWIILVCIIVLTARISPLVLKGLRNE